MAGKEDKFWEEGSFAETMGSDDMEKKMRTFGMKHDEEMNFTCNKCKKKISAHNNDWHGGIKYMTPLQIFKAKQRAGLIWVVG